MFLDAWLGLALWGTAIFGVCVLVAIACVTALVYATRLAKRGLRLKALIFAMPSAAILAIVAGAILVAFTDRRTEREIVIDLRKPQREVALHLKGDCSLRGQTQNTYPTLFCDSHYKWKAEIIIASGDHLLIDAGSIMWNEDFRTTGSYVSLMAANSMSLKCGHQVLMAHRELLKAEGNAEVRAAFEKAAAWILVPNDSRLVSEMNIVRIRPELSLQLRKNVDRINVDYTLVPDLNGAEPARNPLPGKKISASCDRDA